MIFKTLLEMAFVNKDLTPVDDEVSESSHELNKYIDNKGNRFFVKTPSRDLYNSESDPELHVLVEFLSYKIYELFGITTPREVDIFIDNDTLRLATSETGGGHVEFSNLYKYKDFASGFAVDVFIANWDVTGTGFYTGNLLVDSEGNVTRIDPGGSLTFRAQGSKKGEAFVGKTGDEVQEFDTMRNPKISVAADAYNYHLQLVKTSLEEFSKVSWSKLEKYLININETKIVEPISTHFKDKDIAEDILREWKREFTIIINKLKYRYTKLVSLRNKL
jgi:hypothetical protein